MNEQREGLQTKRELELSMSGREENEASHQESRMKLSLKKKKMAEFCSDGVLQRPLAI